MTEPRNDIQADLCVIGAGAAGLSVAAGASLLGLSTVLIERHFMGGECLNSGCVPSKALLAAAHAAETIRRAPRFGVEAGEPRVDWARLHNHVHGVIAGIAPVDSEARYEGLGARVLRSSARLTGPRTIETEDGHRIRVRCIVLATGSEAARPDLPGLDGVAFDTNETLFAHRTAPRHLLVLGGGPIGVEMAHAHRLLGARVTLVERQAILPKDDPELVDLVRRALLRAGVTLHEGATASSIAKGADGDAVLTLADGTAIAADRVLVSVGRRPRTGGLGLDAAGVKLTEAGAIEVDARLHTSVRGIFALGDCIGGPYFTHVAGYQAGIVLRNAVFRVPAKVDYAALPWVTYTDPELAQVGLTEAMARARGIKIQVARFAFAENDRARAERTEEGHVKAVLDASGTVLGCGIVGPRAGELIAPWALCVAQRLKIGAIGDLMLPYPTLSEVSKRAATGILAPKLFAATTRRVVRLLRRLP